MPGIATAESSWLLPGIRPTVGYTASLWLLNTSEEPVSATVGALTPEGLMGEMVVVPPGQPFEYPVIGDTASGLLVEAAAPVTAAWMVRGPTGLAVAVGSAVATVSE